MGTINILQLPTSELIWPYILHQSRGPHVLYRLEYEGRPTDDLVTSRYCNSSLLPILLSLYDQLLRSLPQGLNGLSYLVSLTLMAFHETIEVVIQDLADCRL